MINPFEMMRTEAMKVAIDVTKKYNKCKKIIVAESIIIVLLIGGLVWIGLS